MLFIYIYIYIVIGFFVYPMTDEGKYIILLWLPLAVLLILVAPFDLALSAGEKLKEMITRWKYMRKNEHDQ